MPPHPRLKPSCARAAISRMTGPLRRRFSSTVSSPRAIPEPPPQRWLADLPVRLGKCIMFGCSPAQIADSAVVLQALAREWRGLVAGSEGFLTGGRRGLEGQQIVWGEMDSFQHVNNVAYVRMAESSRVNWATNFAVNVDPAHRKEWVELMTPKSTGLILKSIKVDFKFPMVYPDRVSVYHKLRYPPSAQPSPSSLILDVVILSHKHRRVSAKVEEDVVIYDYRAGKKTEMLPFMKNVLEDTFRLQEEARLRARTRIWDLLRQVERLEKATWDRDDAVEDLGSTISSK